MDKKAPPKSGAQKDDATELWQSIKEQEAVLGSPAKMLFDISEISLILDTYDDIFSNFDPRSYTYRSLSEDFLIQAKKASHNKDFENLELRLLIPKRLRNTSTEAQIKRRLLDHFSRHFHNAQADIRKSRMTGVKKLIVGAALGALAAYLAFYEHSLPAAAILIVLQPASWFTMWTGLEDIFNISEQKKSALSFYEKMARCQIAFIPY